MRIYSIFYLLLFILLFSSCSKDDEDLGIESAVRISVFDDITGVPIANAKVTITSTGFDETNFTRTTDENGKVIFQNLITGTFNIEVSANAYHFRRRTDVAITVSPNVFKQEDVTLIPLNKPNYFGEAHLSSILLTKIPMRDSRGLTWDILPVSDADIYIKVLTVSGNRQEVIVNSKNESPPVIYEDANPSQKALDFTFTPAFSIADGRNYTIQFWDDDKGVKDDELVGSITFNVANYGAGAKEVFEKNLNTEVTLTLDWK